MKSNPPIPGHHLLYEGRVTTVWGSSGRREIHGGCQCGARPEGYLLNVSIRAMKRWHREHKDNVRVLAGGAT